MNKIELRDYQLAAIKKIKDNISSGNKMQTVMMPVGSGKTMIMLHLIKLFAEQGKRVLVCTSAVVLADQIKHTMNSFLGLNKSVDVVTIFRLENIEGKKYDVILSDGALALYEFSNSVISDEKKWTDTLNGIKIKLNRNEELCSGEKRFLGVNSLVEFIKESDAFVVNFDNSPRFGDFGYIPVFSEHNVISFKMSFDDMIADGLALTNEYDNVSRIKREAVLKGRTGADKRVNLEKCLEDIGNRIIRHMDLRCESIDSRLETIQLGIDKISKIVEEVNAKVDDKKDILSLYFSVYDDDNEESDLFVTKVVDRLTNELVAKMAILENQTKYIATDRLVRIRMGENAWAKLDPASVKFLTTAKFMFDKNMDLEDQADYSGVCLLASKAMEVEMAKRLVVEYEKYLEESGVSLNNWPSGLVVYNKKDNTKAKLQLEDFTLGNCPYITGMFGRDRLENNNFFVNYCRDRLLNGLSDEDIRETIIEFNDYIKCIRERYRNPAAHKTMVTLAEASECLDYILEVERILKIMLERFCF